MLKQYLELRSQLVFLNKQFDEVYKSMNAAWNAMSVEERAQSCETNRIWIKIENAEDMFFVFDGGDLNSCLDMCKTLKIDQAIRSDPTQTYHGKVTI